MQPVFFNDTATSEIYTLPLHDALPIYPAPTESAGSSSPPENDALRVALLLTGTINDASYNQQMYEAAEQAKELYGIDIAFKIGRAHV